MTGGAPMEFAIAIFLISVVCLWAGCKAGIRNRYRYHYNERERSERRRGE